MNISAPWPQVLDFLGTPLVIEPSPGQLSSDAGLLAVRQPDPAPHVELAPATSQPALPKCPDPRAGGPRTALARRRL
jgi:hypothetical protein